MRPQLVPLQAAASQTALVTLNGQACQIDVYQTFYGLFCDLYVNNVLAIGGVICYNKNKIVRSTYINFVGDLAFYDSQGSEDPSYAGIGTRFFLVYLPPGFAL